MTSTLARRLDALADWRRALDRSVEQFSAFLVDHELRDASAAAQIEPRRLLMWILAYSGLSAAWILGDGDPAQLDLSIAELAAAELGEL